LVLGQGEAATGLSGSVMPVEWERIGLPEDFQALDGDEIVGRGYSYTQGPQGSRTRPYNDRARPFLRQKALRSWTRERSVVTTTRLRASTMVPTRFRNSDHVQRAVPHLQQDTTASARTCSVTSTSRASLRSRQRKAPTRERFRGPSPVVGANQAGDGRQCADLPNNSLIHVYPSLVTVSHAAASRCC
jgi:hypothetical protein